MLNANWRSNMLSEVSVDEVFMFMHYFEKMLSASGGRPPPGLCFWTPLGTSVLQTPHLPTLKKILQAPKDFIMPWLYSFVFLFCSQKKLFLFFSYATDNSHSWKCHSYKVCSILSESVCSVRQWQLVLHCVSRLWQLSGACFCIWASKPKRESSSLTSSALSCHFA